MARVEYGGGVASFKGSIGGLTFQGNISGNIVRNRPIQKKHQTDKQGIQHNFLTGLQAGWRSLTLSQQTAWNVFAAAHDKTNMWGEGKVLTGYNWFFLLNRNAISMSLAQIVAPPAYLTPNALPVYKLHIEASSVYLLWQSGIQPANTSMFIYTTSFITRTKTPFRSSLRFTKFQENPIAGTIDITTEWETTHNISMPGAGVMSDIKIQALLVPVHATSFIDEAGYGITDHFVEADLGIGAMVIDTSFIIR